MFLLKVFNFNLFYTLEEFKGKIKQGKKYMFGESII